jgi:DNA-binding beta-propeller fold protein YncE
MVVALLVAAVLAAPPAAPAVRALPIQDSPIALTIRARSGTARLTCAIDRGRAHACSHKPTFKVSLGKHTVSVRGLDRQGRASAKRTVTVIVPQREPAGVPAGGEPVGIATANGLVWVSNGSSGTVSAIDPAVKRNVSTFRAGGQLGGIVAGSDAVWVSDFGAGAVVKIDPALNVAVGRIAVGGRPTGLALDATGSLWAGNLDGYVSRIDPVLGRVAAQLPMPSGVSQPLSARGLVWLGLQNGSVVAVDPNTNRLTGSSVSVAADVDALADTPSGLWVSTFAGIAALVDPDRRVVVRRVTLPSRGSGISFAGGSVWVSAYDSGLVVRLQPATGALLGAVHTGPEPRESVAAGGALWVANQLNGTVTPVPLG